MKWFSICESRRNELLIHTSTVQTMVKFFLILQSWYFLFWSYFQSRYYWAWIVWAAHYSDGLFCAWRFVFKIMENLWSLSRSLNFNTDLEVGANNFLDPIFSESLFFLSAHHHQVEAELFMSWKGGSWRSLSLMLYASNQCTSYLHLFSWTSLPLFPLAMCRSVCATLTLSPLAQKCFWPTLITELQWVVHSFNSLLLMISSL